MNSLLEFYYKIVKKVIIEQNTLTLITITHVLKTGVKSARKTFFFNDGKTIILFKLLILIDK